MENLETHNSATRQWIERVSEWAPTIGQAHPVFGRFADLGGLILTGSTTLGVVDEYSDLDLELVLSEDAVAQVDTPLPPDTSSAIWTENLGPSSWCPPMPGTTALAHVTCR